MEIKYENFTENFKMSNYSLNFTAVSYMDYLNSLYPELIDIEENTPIDIGNGFSFLKKPMKPHHIKKHLFGGSDYKERIGLEVYQSARWTTAYFDDNIVIPVLSCNGMVWMSITPMEILTCRPGVKKAKGNVLMGGLGMGWMAKKVLERKNVKKLVVIEKEKAVIDFFGKHLKDQFGDKVEIIEGDFYDNAYDVIENYDSILVDIFSSYGAANYNNDFKKFQKIAVEKNKICWGWGDVQNLPNIPYSFF